jgi:hypothetical protein
MLKRLGKSSEGVLPAEAEIWQKAHDINLMAPKGFGAAEGEAKTLWQHTPEEMEAFLRTGGKNTRWQHTPEEMRAFAGGKTTPPKAPVAAEGRGGAMREVEEVLGAKPQGRTWQHTPEEMRAYAQGGEATLPKATEAVTPSAASAATEAASTRSPLIPVLGGAGLGAGGVLGAQALMGEKSPALSSYYKTGGLAAALRAARDERGIGERFSDAGEVIKDRTSDAIEKLRDKLSADAQITGARGTLLKAKTMKMPKPDTSALPKTPKLQNVMAKLSQSLGDPMFWQGGEQAAAAAPPPASAEEIVTQLPLGTFQGMTTKVSPEGERTTSVNVTPDALGSPEMLQSIFAVEPNAKVELKIPEQTTADVGGPIEGGGEGPPLPEKMMSGAPPPGSVPPAV